MQKINDSVCITLKQNSLIVANTGKSFERKGVLSICYSNLSSKDKKTQIHLENYADCKDNEFIEGIHKRQINKYREDRNDLEEHSKNEIEKRRDYTGRYLLELLQNADDAMGDSQYSLGEIGSKGIGFKSILEISEEPEIFSGDFHFKFSAQLTQTKLKEIYKDPPKLTFRVPHLCNKDAEIESFLKDFTTVIRFTLTDEATEKVSNELQSFDQRSLLFVQNIKHLKINHFGSESIYEVKGSRTPLDATVLTLSVTKDQQLEKERWKRWSTIWVNKKEPQRKQSIAIVLPIDKKNNLQPTREYENLYVYFKTKVKLFCKALIHASFDPSSDRNHVRDRDEDPEIDNEILDELQKKISDIILTIPPEIAIQSFNLSQYNDLSEEEMNLDLEQKIYHQLYLVIKNTPFIPVVGNKKKCIEEVSSLDSSIVELLKTETKHVQDLYLLDPKLKNYFSVFSDNGIKDFSKPGDALIFCQNNTYKDCFKVLEKLDTLAWDNFSEQNGYLEIPCWWTLNGKARSLDDQKPFLYEEISLPKWLHDKFDVLDNNFRNKFDSLRNEDGLINEEDYEISDRLIDEDEIFLKVIYSDVATWNDKRWQELGFDVLNLIFRFWSNIDDDQIKQINNILVPTNNGWSDPKLCYADYYLQENETLEQYTNNRKDRFILLPIKKWKKVINKKDIDKWKSILNDLGVSFGPKIMEFNSFGLKIREKEPLIRKFLSEVKDYSLFLRKDFLVEDFPSPILKIFSNNNNEVYFKILEKLFYDSGKYIQQRNYGKRLGRSGDVRHPADAKGIIESFLQYQFLESSCIPTKPCLMNSKDYSVPHKSFYPGTGFGDILPEVKIEDPSEYSKLFKALGVNSRLPRKYSQWIKILSEFGNIENKKKNYKQASIKLYNKFFGQKFSKNEVADIPRGFNVPCLADVGKNRSIYFADKNSSGTYGIVYVDQKSLDDEIILKKLIEKRGGIFVIKFNDRASSYLGLAKLSSILDTKIKKIQELKDQSKIISRLYKQFFPALKEAAEIISDNNTLKKSIKVKVFENISRTLIYEKEKIENNKNIPYHFEQQNNEILISNQKDISANLDLFAEVLAESFADKKNTFNFEHILKCKSKEELMKVIKKIGIDPDTYNHLNKKFNDSSLKYYQEDHGSQKEDDGTKELPPVDKEGIEAQNRLFEKIKEKLEAKHWNVEQEKKKVDITITKGEKKIFIEVKLRTILWRKKQIQFAKNHPNQYFIAYLDKEENVRWIFDPLKEFSVLGSKVTLKDATINDNKWNYSFSDMLQKINEPTNWMVQIPLSKNFIADKKIDSNLNILLKKIR